MQNNVVFQSHCLKMPFPTHVIVTLEKEGTFSCPPEEFREKMLSALNEDGVMWCEIWSASGRAVRERL